MAKKVLIIDDSQVDRNHLSKIISAAGWDTLTAENGVKGIASAKANVPDVILMDVNMPEMDGFAATRALRNDESTAKIPVILVTAKDQRADKAWGKMLGAKDYITKPFKDEEVIEAIHNL